MRFIGDVHGYYKTYTKIISEAEKSIQVGDMGVGFVEIPEINLNHRFIRGNHDNPFLCTKHSNCIKDGTFEDEMFFLGGAWSIDWEDRILGISWWEGEELSVPELQKCIDKYVECKPEIMVTHDCPTVMAQKLNSHREWDKSKTRQALDRMFEAHKPEVWVHGHHHIYKQVMIKGTRFISLGELEYIDL